MRKSVLLCAGAMLLFATADAAAQWGQPLDGRLVLSLNGGGQVGSTDLSRQRTFSLYEEEARFESDQTAKTGGMLDVGGVYRIGRNWGVGVGYTASEGTNDAAVAGTIPHPLFFAQPRTASLTVPGLDTRETAVHLQAVLFVPFVEKVDFMFAAGPSFFNVQQGFATGISISEVPPAYNALQVDGVEITQLRRNGTGFHVSGDVTYSITEAIGAGLLLRFTRATVEFPFADGSTVELTPGGLQVAAGIRLRF
jgi:hypothetical protein